MYVLRSEWKGFNWNRIFRSCLSFDAETNWFPIPAVFSFFGGGGGECKGGYTVISSFLWHICSQISLVVESSLITFLACFHKNITNGFSPGRFFRWAKSLPATSFTLRVCIALSIQQVVNVGKRRKVFEMSKKWVVLQPFDRSSLLVKWAVKVFVLPMTTYSVNR